MKPGQEVKIVLLGKVIKETCNGLMIAVDVGGYTRFFHKPGTDLVQDAVVKWKLDELTSTK